MIGIPPSEFRHLRMTELSDAVDLHKHEKWHDRMIAVNQLAAVTGTKLDKLTHIAGTSPLSDAKPSRSPSRVSDKIIALRKSHNEVAGDV